MYELKTKEEKIENCYFQTNQYTEDWVDKKDIVEFTKNYQYTPVVVTIKDVEVEMEDEFNGYVRIELSNGDIVIYECIEKKYRADHLPKEYCGPDACSSFYINDDIVGGQNLLEKYSYGGNWVALLLEIYENYQK